MGLLVDNQGRTILCGGTALEMDMATAARRRANLHPINVTPGPAGVAPSQVGTITPGTPGTTTLPVSYTAATGTAPITYQGYTSPHGAGTWTLNSGPFGSTGGTFAALTASTNYDLRIVASNAYGSSTRDNLTGVTTASAGASTFTIALNRGSGAPGAPVAMTATPATGGWPSGEMVTPSASGLAGSFDSNSLVGSGTMPVVFNFTPSGGPGSSGTLSASASGMVNTSGAQGYGVNAVISAGTANRYDLTMSSSTAPAGNASTVTVTPNGNLPSGSITLAGSGTFSPGPTITLSSGSNAPVTVQYTPSSNGEHAISGTNTAGMYNPYAAPLTVFSGSSGTARTLAANLRLKDMHPHQRDTANGNPAGFSFGWAKGWGEVWFDIGSISGATDGLWIKLYDALSSGASGSLGSGTVLNGAPVQVYGAVSAAGRVRVLLPAGPYWYYAELATDAAFSNPVRVQQRFGVGITLGIDSRSQNNGIASGWNYGAVPGLGYVNYTKFVSCCTVDARYPNGGRAWFRLDGVSVDNDAYGAPSSTGGMELGRLLESQLGVISGVVGCAANGYGFDTHLNSDGSLGGGVAGMINDATDGTKKFRYFMFFVNEYDGPALGYSDVHTRLTGLVPSLANNYPALAVMALSTATGQFGSDGSWAVGYTRTNMIFRDEIEPVNPMVVCKDEYDWNQFKNGHSSWLARMHYARAYFRALMDGELAAFGGNQSTQRGPTLAGSGTRQNGSLVLKIPYTLNGGTQLVGKKWLDQSWLDGASPTYDQYSTPSSGDLTTLFGVYPAGGYANNGTAIMLDQTNGVTWDGSFIYLTLDNSHPGLATNKNGSTQAMPSNFAVNYGADFSASGAGFWDSGTCITIYDDRVDNVNGIAYGRQIRPKLDIIVNTV